MAEDGGKAKDGTDVTSSQKPKKKLYPKAIIVYMIFSNISSFTLYMRSGLIIRFFNDVMMWKQHEIMTITYVPSFFPTLMYPVAALLADSYVGYFWSFFGWTVIRYPVVFLSPFTLAYYEYLPIWELYWGYFIIIPCIGSFAMVALSPFLGEQFILPDEKDLYTSYLFTSYWFHNISVNVAYFIGPDMRSKFSCFGRPDCYFAPYMIYPFGQGLLIVSMIIFIKWYRKPPPPKKFMLFVVLKMCWHAIKQKYKSTEKKSHWLDYASDKYDEHLIKDAKRLKILLLICPLCLHSAVLSMEASNWIFQAKGMNGDLGFYHMHSEQIAVFNTSLCVVLIPLFSYAIFPYLEKRKMFTNRLLRKCVGHCFYIVGWTFAAVLVYQVEKLEHPRPANGMAQFRIFNNNKNGTLLVSSTIFGEEEDISVEAMSFFGKYDVKIDGTETFELSYSGASRGNFSFQMTEKKMTNLYFSGGEMAAHYGKVDANPEHVPVIRTIFNLKNKQDTYDYYYEVKEVRHLKSNSSDIEPHIVATGKYSFFLEDQKLNERFDLKLGGLYVNLVNQEEGDNFTSTIVIVHPSNRISILWMFPQFFASVIGEIISTVAHSELVYTQAPVSMKACVVAFNIIISSFGRTMVGIIDFVFKIQLISSRTVLYLFVEVACAGVYIYMLRWYNFVMALNKAGEEAGRTDQ